MVVVVYYDGASAWLPVMVTGHTSSPGEKPGNYYHLLPRNGGYRPLHPGETGGGWDEHDH
ncbi:MAG TPA: hypothetical protein ENN44_02565 [Methanoculleus sp.]|nr:hypothetical protein [Methanoculleus sp.]